MTDMGLNGWTWLNPAMKHPTDEDAERLFSVAITDSPWLEDWQAQGGFSNPLWASGLEHLAYPKGYEIGQTCALGVGIMDAMGWRGSGILNGCGHTVEIKTFDQYYTYKYMQELPHKCKKCRKLLETNN